MAPEESQAALVTVHGIGPWTAEVYLMFAWAFRTFSPADLALQEGAKLAMGLETRPSTKQMAELPRAGRHGAPSRPGPFGHGMVM